MQYTVGLRRIKTNKGVFLPGDVMTDIDLDGVDPRIVKRFIQAGGLVPVTVPVDEVIINSPRYEPVENKKRGRPPKGGN